VDRAVTAIVAAAVTVIVARAVKAAGVMAVGIVGLAMTVAPVAKDGATVARAASVKAAGTRDRLPSSLRHS